METILENTVKIRKSMRGKALKLLKEEYAFDIGNCKSLKAALNALSLQMTEDQDGDMINFTINSKSFSSLLEMANEFLPVLGPCVEKGSVFHLIDDDVVVKMEFDGNKTLVSEGKVVYKFDLDGRIEEAFKNWLLYAISSDDRENLNDLSMAELSALLIEDIVKERTIGLSLEELEDQIRYVVEDSNKEDLKDPE